MLELSHPAVVARRQRPAVTLLNDLPGSGRNKGFEGDDLPRTKLAPIARIIVVHQVDGLFVKGSAHAMPGKISDHLESAQTGRFLDHTADPGDFRSMAHRPDRLIKRIAARIDKAPRIGRDGFDKCSITHAGEIPVQFESRR